MMIINAVIGVGCLYMACQCKHKSKDALYWLLLIFGSLNLGFAFGDILVLFRGLPA